MIVLLDNQDSFVYNLVDAFADYDTVVYRNTVTADTVLNANPDLIVLSPGPGYPADAGCMMEVIERAQGRIPILGICLGFQALMEHFGGRVEPCGPVHGSSQSMVLNDGRRVPVARYHSLGATTAPPGITPLAWTGTEIGDVIMAAETDDGMSIGLQFHPESILTPSGPQILYHCVTKLLQKGHDND